MHWSLEQLRDLDEDEFDELLAWANERSQQNDPDSVDADVLVEAARRRDQAKATEGDDH